jgi:hypothetical protein
MYEHGTQQPRSVERQGQRRPNMRRLSKPMSMCSRVRLSRALTVVAAKLENVCLNVPGVHDGMGTLELVG